MEMAEALMSSREELSAESMSYRAACELPDCRKRINSGHFEYDLV
jgi:hypothetical protein